MRLPRQVEELIVEIMTRDEGTFLPQRCENFLSCLSDAGYAIVPREPTETMLKAAYDAAVPGLPMGRVQPPFCNEESRISEDQDTMLIGYRAMIGAANQ